MTTSHAVSLWKGILAMEDHFKKAIAWRLAMGEILFFWEDTWCCPRPLRMEIPTIINIASNKAAIVADYWSWEGDIDSWNIQLCCQLKAWEIE